MCPALLAWFGVVLVIFGGITIVLRIESRHGGGAAEPGPTSGANVEGRQTQRVPRTREWPVVVAFMITIGVLPMAYLFEGHAVWFVATGLAVSLLLVLAAIYHIVIYLASIGRGVFRRGGRTAETDPRSEARRDRAGSL